MVSDIRSCPMGVLIYITQIFRINTSTIQLQAIEAFSKAQGNQDNEYAAIESIHAFLSSGLTTLSAIIVYTKPVGNASIFDGVLDGRPQLSNDLCITKISTLTIETAARKSL